MRNALLAALLVWSALSPMAVRSLGNAPKLIVVISIDQFRGDYVQQYRHQWTRGLNRLFTEGAYFPHTDYPFLNTVTCAGHATISTGALPRSHGMILNEWWDRTAGKLMACTEDEHASPITYGKTPRFRDSAARLGIPTLGDELRAQLPARPRIVTFSIKARAAITLAGHAGDAVTWFDPAGTFATSNAFASVPIPWIASFIRQNPVERDFDKVWERSLPLGQYLYEEEAIGAIPLNGMTRSLPHALKGTSTAPDRAFYENWQDSPFSDEYLGRLAETAIDTLRLGKGPSVDYLAIGFSALDKIGHDFGPRSHEVQDVLVRIDRTIGSLLARIERLAGRGNYVVALTSDHGVSPIPEQVARDGIDAGYVKSAAIRQNVEQALAKILGPGRYVSRLVFTDLYLANGVYDTIRTKPGAMKAVLDAIRSVDGVGRTITRDELEANDFADDPVGRAAALSYYPGRSGDIVILPKPYWVYGTTASTHGTYQTYDTRVPLVLMGKAIKPGEYLQPASPADIAPTLAHLAGITLSRVDGRVLREALATPSPAKPSTAASPQVRR
jgi:predicted AlkP superfamily pyrophosphatase or phosphodiesterase